MKNKYILPIIVIIALFTACNETEIPMDTTSAGAEVIFNTSVDQGSSVEGLKSTSTNPLYDRDGAPAELAGLTIKAQNQTYTSYDLEEDFYFADADDVNNPIIMSVKAGTNVFNAVGIPANDEPIFGSNKRGMAGMHHWFRDTLVYNSKPTDGYYYHEDYPDHRMIYTDETAYPTMEARAAKYGEWILEHIPLYAEYTSDTITKSISSAGGNVVDFTLQPQNGRINFIIELLPESHLGYALNFRLYESDGSVVMYDHDNDSSTDDIEFLLGQVIHSYYTAASAWIFNSDELIPGRYAEVTISKRSTKSQSAVDWEPLIETGELTVPVQVGKNINFLIYLNDITLETAMDVQTITFEEVTNENTGNQL